MVTWLLVATALSLPAQAQVGHRAHSYAGFAADSGGAITGEKPESKLWHHDGGWWGAMVSLEAGGAHTIHRLSGTTWVDTGVLIDERPATKEDILSLGPTLYILSRGSSSIGDSKLRRFSYSGGRYSLDPGFPVSVPGAAGETNTLARDGTGTLWIVYDQSRSVRVARSLDGDDRRWSQPFQLPFAQARSLTSDDIAAVTSFKDDTGPAIGVMWSNQNDQAQYFAVHRDGTPADQWTLETALSGPLEADDHINLKTAEGRVYGVVKTSASDSAASLIRLLVRSEKGQWSRHPVARKDEGHTRPITMLQLDTANRDIYIFMTRGTGPRARGIQYKKSSMTGIGFAAESTWFIQGPDGEPINNPTSMKANANAQTGIVVLASDGQHYWWNRLGGTDDPPAPTPTEPPDEPPPPSGGTVFHDRFTRSSNTNLVDHTPTEVGEGWVESFNSSTVVQRVVAAVNATGATGNQSKVGHVYAARPSPSSADYTVEAAMERVRTDPSGTRPFSLLARYNPTTHTYYQLYVQAGRTPAVGLRRSVNGSIRTLATNTNFATANGDSYSLEVDGSTLRAYVNGVQVLTATDKSITAAGQVAFAVGSPSPTASGHLHSDWQVGELIVTTLPH